MDFQVGIRGDGFTMLCCDTRAVHSIITIKNDEDKLVPIDKHRLFAVSGEAGERHRQFNPLRTSKSFAKGTTLIGHCC